MAFLGTDQPKQDRSNRPLSEPERRLRSLRGILVVSILIALGAGFYGGIWYNRRSTAASDPIIKTVVNKDGTGTTSAVDFSLFWQVWDKLYDKFVDRDKLDAQALVYGAITGMVGATGDPYTNFFPPVESRQFQEQVSGAFSGVGMEIGERDGFITVIAPIKNSPAMRAGVKAGDRVIQIEKESTAGLSVDEAVTRIRGKQGTTVHLTLTREGVADPIELSIVRDIIKIPAVDWKMLDGKVAYVQILSFNANVADAFALAAKELTAQGATSLIIDLRNDPGGLLDQAVDVAGWMLKPDSVVVLERYGNGATDELRANGNARLADLPTIVIINGGSASASEILAGALHDIRNIRLVGEKSFGKGSVQQLDSFYNGSSLKVTVAKWLTPKGTSISETGIAPTDPVAMDPKNPEASTWQIGEPGKDPQLDRAIDIIRQ